MFTNMGEYFEYNLEKVVTCILSREKISMSVINTCNYMCVYLYILWCKHSEVDQTSAPLYESRGFLGQMPISSSRMLLKIDYFS